MLNKFRQRNISKYIALAFLVLAAIEITLNYPQSASLHDKADSFIGQPILTEKAKQHILYGNETGGGHKHGINKACKSEFPKHWNDQKIIATIKKVAANDNLHWQKQNNGYYVAEEKHDAINVRVVLGRQQKKVITAYPTNVKRNPCP